MIPVYLGIDTSNYTTSTALCSADGRILSQCKTPLKVKAGERGLRQSDAVFQHTKNLPPLLEEILFQNNYRIMAVGYSAKPRNAEDSYMPCFLAGESVARSIAAACRIPGYSFSHQSGHIMAAAYSAHAEALLQNPFLAFHLSGGTTDLVLGVPVENDFQITLLATSEDLHAGQVIDRVGVLLGLHFPCGPRMEELANAFHGKLEPVHVCVRGNYCNLSGVENQAQKMMADGKMPEEIAAYVFAFLQQTIIAMVKSVNRPQLPVLFVGGVMSNHRMREELSTMCQAYFAEPAFSCDNAAGIAYLTYRKYTGKAEKEHPICGS